MSIKQFIKENKTMIDEHIKRQCPGARLNDAERRLWILNDYGLYIYAKREGVRI